MNNTFTGFKRYLSAAIVLLLGLVLALSVIRMPSFDAFAVEQENFVEPTATLDISNKQFTSDGSRPSSPSGWTGAGVSGSGDGGVVSGVISLDAASYAKDNAKTDDAKEDPYKLERYPEYKSVAPQTPFGVQAYAGTNKNVLMINTADTETAFGYTSASVNLAAASYYRIGVYVKTGNFAEGKGATVKLNGLPETTAFRNINTVAELEKDPSTGLPVLNADNLYGFKKFTFYIATPLSSAKDVTLSLQVGDRVDDEENPENNYYNPAKGYAFFDNVEAERISPNSYYSETAVYENKDGYIVKDFTKSSVYLTDGDIDYMYTGADAPEANEIGSFEFDGGLEVWEQILDIDDANYNSAITAVYDTNGTFSKDNQFSLTTRPYSPIGNLHGDDGKTASKILLISATKPVSVGFRSPKYTVLRNTYYRLSYWVNTDSISGGAGATTVIRGTNGVADDDNKLVVTSTGLTGDSSDMNYGWKQYTYLIKGSAIADYEFSLELWLGQPGSNSSGVAMFDEIKIEKITPSEYSSNTASATTVTFDPSFGDTGVPNGKFFEVGEYDEYVYPLAPASWTRVTTDSSETTGYSKNEVESAKDAVTGLIATDVEHFTANRDKYNNVDNPRPSKGNLLMLSSVEDTAVGYASTAVTISSGKTYKLTASLRADHITGYGANLIVKSGENVIATIEGIKDTGNGFKTYTFYIEGGASDYTATLEIWLGMGDRTDNTRKLAAGTLFVDRVEFAEATDANYADLAAQYDSLRSSGQKDFSFATYSFGRIDFNAYDTYQDSFVKTPYNFSLAFGAASNTKYGIFDPSMLDESNTDIPSTFRNEDGGNVLYFKNIAPSYSAIALNNTVTLPANSYYSVQVGIKVDLADSIRNDPDRKKTVVGAGILLTGADSKFENIIDTSTVVVNDPNRDDDDFIDDETFKTYTFYIKVGDSSVDVGLTFTLGGIEHNDQYFAGRVYINKIAFTDIGSVAYENELKNFDEKSTGYDKHIKYNNNVDLSSEDTEGDDEGGDETEEETPTELAWWLIPSILFGVAVIIAVVGTLIRKLVEKRSRKKSVKATTSYDRRNTLEKIHNAKETKGENKVAAEGEDAEYDEFDDTLSAPVDKPEEAKAEETDEKEEKPAETETKESSSDSYDEFDDDKPEGKAEAETEKSEDVKKGEKAEAENKSAASKPKESKDGYSDDFED